VGREEDFERMVLFYFVNYTSELIRGELKKKKSFGEKIKNITIATKLI